MNEKIIIGIDPGTRITGYAIVRVYHTSFSPLDYGCIKPPAKLALSDRYEIIFSSIQKLIEQYAPHEMAIETPFFAKNPQSTLKLGIALACALLAGKTKGLRVFGYSPREVKSAVVGTEKPQKRPFSFPPCGRFRLKQHRLPKMRQMPLLLPFATVQVPQK